MPRLPDVQSFGPRPTPRPVDATPDDRGIQSALYSEGRAAGNLADANAQRGSAGQVMGRALANAADTMDSATAYIKRREDIIGSADATTAFATKGEQALRDFQTQGDFAKVETGQNFARQLDDMVAKIVGGFKGSADAAAQLHAHLMQIRAGLVDKAAQYGMEAQSARIGANITSQVSVLASKAYDAPGGLADSFDALDSTIARASDALTPEQEQQYRTLGRRQIAASALNSLLDNGAVGSASRLLKDDAIASVLTPDQIVQAKGRVNTLAKAKNEVTQKQIGQVNELRYFLGREPTLSEATAFVQSRLADPGNDADSIRRSVESATGETLSADQLSRIERPKSAAGASFSDISQMRKQFLTESADFIAVRDAYNRIQTSGNNPSPAGDLSLMFNYMKMLDPGSVVRESEFAQVAATGSYGTQLQAAAKRFLNGERLTEDQRKDFMTRSRELFVAQSKTQKQLEDQFSGIAKRNNITPEDVTVDFLGDLRSVGEVPRVTSDEDYAKLKSGAVFIGPDGKKRTKP